MAKKYWKSPGILSVQKSGNPGCPEIEFLVARPVQRYANIFSSEACPKVGLQNFFVNLKKFIHRNVE